MQSCAFCGAWCKIVPFLDNSPVWCFIYIFFIFQWLKKKSANLFSLKIKSSEKKNVYINYFHRNLKFLKIESQKIRKIVMRKFAIISSSLIFKISMALQLRFQLNSVYLKLYNILRRKELKANYFFENLDH